MLEGQSLTPTTEDIYFFTGFSRRWEPVNFRTFPFWPLNIEELIGLHCEAGTDKMGTQVPIRNIFDLSLKVIFFLIGRITRFAALHQASRAQMNCVI
jgi:hypothetical protein